MLPKRYTQDVQYATQEVYPRGILCYPRCIPKRYTMLPKRYGPYLLDCVSIPLGLHMHTSWTACPYLLGCKVQPKRYAFGVTQEVYLLPKGYRYTSWVTLCIPLGLHFIPLGYQCHTSWVTSMHSKRYEKMHSKRYTQEV